MSSLNSRVLNSLSPLSLSTLSLSLSLNSLYLSHHTRMSLGAQAQFSGRHPFSPQTLLFLCVMVLSLTHTLSLSLSLSLPPSLPPFLSRSLSPVLFLSLSRARALSPSPSPSLCRAWCHERDDARFADADGIA
jgi:hypothetical protein